VNRLDGSECAKEDSHEFCISSFLYFPFWNLFRWYNHNFI